VANTDATVPSLAITGVNLANGATVKDSVGNEANLAGAVTSFNFAVDPPSSPPPSAAPLPSLFGGDATQPSSTVSQGGDAISMQGVSVNAATPVTSTISMSNVAVPALAITPVNLPAGSIIVDAAGDAANLSGITQPLTEATGVATILQAISDAQVATTDSATITLVRSSAGSSSPNAAMLGVSSNSLAFITQPSGSGGLRQTAAGSAMPGSFSVAVQDAAAASPARAGQFLAGWLSATPFTDPVPGIPASVGSSGTTLPLFSTMSAAANHTKAAGL
jgi:hypothetical protein